MEDRAKMTVAAVAAGVRRGILADYDRKLRDN
jgi:hypothetical protein